MKKILLICIFSLLLIGCNNSKENESKDYKKIMAESEYIIIDVRSLEEYNTSHIVDSVNIEVDKLLDAELDKEKVIFVYCASGKRSKTAYQILKNEGYKVYNLGALNDINLPKE